MNQLHNVPPRESQTTFQSLRSAALSPITGAVSYLSALRGFLSELPRHQQDFATLNLFKAGEFELLDVKWAERSRRLEAPPGAGRDNFFLQQDSYRLAVSAQGIVVVKESMTTSTRGDQPVVSHEILRQPTVRDVINLARVTSYEDVKNAASRILLRRNEEFGYRSKL